MCHVVVKGTAKDLFAAGMPEITTCKAAGNTVLLTWNKYENADSYIILRRKMGESKFAKIATVKDLSYTDTAFSPSTPYYYSVQAVSTKWGGAIKSSYDKTLCNNQWNCTDTNSGTDSKTENPGCHSNCR